MSTKSTIWLGTDESGRDCHLYWELAERIPSKAAPIFMSIEARGKKTAIRLPKEVGEGHQRRPDRRRVHCRRSGRAEMPCLRTVIDAVGLRRTRYFGLLSGPVMDTTTSNDTPQS